MFEGGVVSNLIQDDGNKQGSEVQEGDKFFTHMVDFDFNVGDNVTDSESKINNTDLNSNVQNREGLEEDDRTFHPALQRPRTIAVTKLQLQLHDLLLKHNASLLLFDEICELFNGYLSSPNFDRFVMLKAGGRS